MLLVSYGAGTDSTAELIEMVKRDIRPDLILFADTGGERPETYWYVVMFSLWLVGKGFPPITTVKSSITLEEDCLKRKALPSLAYGFKSCSQRFKAQPQDKFANHFEPFVNAWKNGETVTKAIGYEYGEERRMRESGNKKYTNWFPLIEWEMDRDACKKTISDAGLPQPGKSSCFFCPSMTKKEILELRANHYDLLKRALLIEIRASITTSLRLGRSFSWMKFIKHTRYMEIEQSKALCGEKALGGGNYQKSLFIETVEQTCGCYDG